MEYDLELFDKEKAMGLQKKFLRLVIFATVCSAAAGGLVFISHVSEEMTCLATFIIWVASIYWLVFREPVHASEGSLSEVPNKPAEWLWTTESHRDSGRD